DFENMLAMMLSRATGNRSISVLDRSYPGRSVDASVRNFKGDALSFKPDFTMIMYGLNDQVCGCSLEGFLEQYEWLARHLADECGSDTVFLQPTPHIDISVNKENLKPDSNPPEFAFRTIGFAESLRLQAEKMKIPCAETFNAIWGDGGATIEESAKKMWPLYPPSYSKQFASMIETDGKGDTIHPNALGHLMIAKAVYNSIACRKSPELLETKAVSVWTGTGVISTITVTNRSDKAATGRIAVFPRLECGPLHLQGSGEYSLKPGESAEFNVDWPDALKPEDLLKYPAIACLAPGNPVISTVIFSEGKSHVSGIPAPFGTPAFLRKRMVAEIPKIQARLDNGEKIEVDLPANRDNGRIPLICKVPDGWAVAEIAFCRYSSAMKGEALVDGDDGEWAENKWSLVADPSQARWIRGTEDRRSSPAECNLQWTSRAGGQGLFLAIKANGSVDTDNFTLFFDERKPELLGTPGPYYWVSGSWNKDGSFKVSKGETSKKATGLAGKWKKTDYGAFVEIFIPYDLLDISSWPESGDLGFSLWWTHRGTGGVTNLMWSEDGHPWSTRWYGVIRLENQPGKSLPWMVRIK
ncbi:MAG: SGNH/GDSL hydrolase family protein, partial [Victivallales bacterium]